jgi:hypothetical protein
MSKHIEGKIPIEFLDRVDAEINIIRREILSLQVLRKVLTGDIPTEGREDISKLLHRRHKNMKMKSMTPAEFKRYMIAERHKTPTEKKRTSEWQYSVVAAIVKIEVAHTKRLEKCFEPLLKQKTQMKALKKMKA